VERSVRGDLLVFSDPLYVAKLLKGTKMIMASLLLAVLLVVLTIVTLAARMPGALQLVSILGLGVTGLFLLGWWMLTERDLAQLSSNKGEKARRGARVALLAVGGTALVAPLLYLIGTGNIFLSLVVGLANFVAMGIGFYSGMLYIRGLAPRVPSKRAVRRADTLMVLLGVVMGMFLLGAAGGVGFVASEGSAVAVDVFVLVAGITSLSTLIMYYNLFSWLRKDLMGIVEAQRAEATLQ
jgi:hypothetical protein